jgi:hypothetical protein
MSGVSVFSGLPRWGEEPRPGGLPLTAITLTDGGIVEVELLAEAAAVRQLRFVIDPYPGGIDFTHPLDDVSEVAGPDRRAARPLAEAVLAFWRATGARPAAAGSPSLMSRPTVRRMAAVGPLTYQLTRTDEASSWIDVGADAAVAYVHPPLPADFDGQAIGASVRALHVARTRGWDAMTRPDPVVARSVGEAGAFLEMALPAREGDIDWRREVVVLGGKESGEFWVYFKGWYGEDFLRVTIHVPAGLTQDLGDGRYLSHGTGRSTLLDAGQWMMVCQLHLVQAAAYERASPFTPPDAETCRAIHQELRLAVAAVEEAAKFVAEQADTVANDAIWSARGRFVGAQAPDAFRRTTIEAWIAEARRRFEEFTTSHEQYVR